MFRRPWTVVIVGWHSGHETELTFMRAWRRSTAERWSKLIRVDDAVGVKVVRRS